MRPVDEISDPAKLLQFTKGLRLLQYSDGATLADTTSLLYKIALLADKNLPIKAFLDLVRQIQKNEGRRTCFEDEFVLAVSYLDLEVSKLGAITYLKGESPDYKETKRNRTLLDTREEGVLKSLSSGLTRPNEDRGGVEMGMIESAHKRMAKLIDLQNAMADVVKRLESGATKLDILREVKVGILKEKLTLTDYDIITRMARREGKLKFRNRQKDPENSYELNVENHDRIKAVASKLGMTPRRALNKVLDDFFTLTEKQQQFGAASGALSGKSKAKKG